MSLTPLDIVDVQVVLALAGPGLRVFDVPGAVVALGESSTVIVADANDDDAISGVWNDREFRLIGPAPAAVAERFLRPMPFTGVKKPEALPVHVAVRGGETCVYVGIVQGAMYGSANGELERCHFRIDPPLSRETLAVVRPISRAPVLPALGWLDRVDTAPEQVLGMFVTTWFPESEPQPASRIPSSVPQALANFYRLAERRPSIHGRQNRIVPVADLRADDSAGRLVFADENQGGWDWSIPWDIDAEETDPRVLLDESGDLAPEKEPLSRFLLQFVLYEAGMTAPYLALPRRLSRSVLPALASKLQHVPLRSFLAPIAPTEFLVGPGVVAHFSTSLRGGDEVDVWIGALYRSALGQFAGLDIEWRRFDG
jgi:hypothetical protein